MKKLFTLIVGIMFLFGCSSFTPPTKPQFLSDEKNIQPIEIRKVYVGTPNFVGGVDFMIVLKNTSGRSIKYLDVSVIPFNRVGDVVEDEISGEALKVCKVTGPIFPSNKYELISFETVWYNKNITSVSIVKVVITYMDNSSQSFQDDSLKLLWYKR